MFTIIAYALLCFKIAIHINVSEFESMNTREMFKNKISFI